MGKKDSNVKTLQQRTTQLAGNKDVSPFLPTQQEFENFKLPKNFDINKLRAIADTVALADLGVSVPHGRYPDRFEAGFRYGLAHNARTDIKTHFRPSFSHGFCFAKCFYRKFNPRSRLAVSGNSRMKITAEE